ncbi:MAG: hypothetical protein E3J70_11085 [Candidatus Heimdallarchaeota archaeon]|nr:MAG: hypothetical protein E3J70_11085 [Candidatus Heimdallarchaeota archaeon]
MNNSLNWSNDPLLFDPEPSPMNDWLTANKLLSKDTLASKEGKLYALVNENILSLNLYPILVRKIDFIREKESDRILSRFPFIVLTEEEKELIKKEILLIAETARDYFYRAINSKISAWRSRLNTYLERGAMPYPLYRCACKVLNVLLMINEIESQFFESARGKRYAIPTKISKQLAYLCGVINGDGHLHKHYLRVTDETKEHIKLISDLLGNVFSDTGEIFKSGNAWNVELRSSSAVRLINFLTDHSIHGPKYQSLREPILFKHLGEPYRSLYWRGAMDADGSFKHHISFGSASEMYVSDFNTYLHSIGIKSKIGKIKDYAFCLTIPAFYRLKFINLIGVDNPKKKSDMLQLLKLVRCQFKGLKQENLIEGKYFNLLKLSSLSLFGIGKYLTKIRGNKTIKARSKELGIAANLYSDYENESRTLTLRTLQKILQVNSKTLMIILTKQPNLQYQCSTSEQVKLPIIITSKIIEIMSLFEPTKTYVKLLHNDSKMTSEIVQLFGLHVEHGRINSRVVLKFCKTFGVYPKPTVDELRFDSIRDYLK